MFRLSGLFFILIAVFCAVLLFQTSQSVQRLEDELAAIEEKNAKEKDEIRVLATEWDYLNSPQRLENIISGAELQSSVDYITEAEKIPQPAAPVIPKHKPSFINYVVPSIVEPKRED